MYFGHAPRQVDNHHNGYKAASGRRGLGPCLTKSQWAVRGEIPHLDKFIRTSITSPLAYVWRLSMDSPSVSVKMQAISQSRFLRNIRTQICLDWPMEKSSAGLGVRVWFAKFSFPIQLQFRQIIWALCFTTQRSLILHLPSWQFPRNASVSAETKTRLNLN